MRRRVLESWLLLLYIDWLAQWGGFSRVHKAVSQYTGRRRKGPVDDESSLSRAVDLACVFYFKRVLCLQRSAALAVLLRRYGCNGELVIGAQILPFLSHAWVELEGRVVNDKPNVIQVFQVLDRC
jgi:hypothetical protein